MLVAPFGLVGWLIPLQLEQKTGSTCEILYQHCSVSQADPLGMHGDDLLEGVEGPRGVLEVPGALTRWGLAGGAACAQFSRAVCTNTPAFRKPGLRTGAAWLNWCLLPSSAN